MPHPYTDASGWYACDAGSFDPRDWVPLSRYHNFCKAQLAALKQDMAFKTLAKNDSLGALISLFSLDTLPGGSAASVVKYPMASLTPAQERLEFILWMTHSGTRVHFTNDFGFSDTGFNPAYQDSAIWRSSSNQVGHFLTAVHLGYDPFVDDDTSIACIVGHENVADDAYGGSYGSISTNSKQCLNGLLDVDEFVEAAVADTYGDYARRDCLLASILDSGWEHREGNSPQDLLLSLKGWIFGKRLLNQEIQSLNGAKNWLIQNLR